MEKEISPFSYDDYNDLLFKTVKSKIDNTISIITACDKDSVLIGSVWRLYARFMKEYTFLDGSPCGKINL